jgi:hypothetical protein
MFKDRGPLEYSDRNVIAVRALDDIVAFSTDDARVVVAFEALPHFLSFQQHAQFVFYDFAPLFWRVEQLLKDQPNEDFTSDQWWNLVDSGRAHDASILEQLVRFNFRIFFFLHACELTRQACCVRFAT